MTETYRFFDLVNYTEADFAEFVNHMARPDGVFADIGGGQLAVSAPGGMTVNVADGEVALKGFWYRNSAALGVSIGSNSSGSTRIDTIVLRLDRAANTLSIQKVVGTPGAGAPALTQVAGGTWEFPLADVSVANGAGSITSGNLTDRRTYSIWPLLTLNSALATDAEVAAIQSTLQTNINNEASTRATNDANEATARAGVQTNLNNHAATPHVRAWGEFLFLNNNGGISVLNVYGCTLSFQGTSQVQITFTPALPNANYIVHVNYNPRSGDSAGVYGISSKLASGVVLTTGVGGQLNGNQYVVFSIIQ